MSTESCVNMGMPLPYKATLAVTQNRYKRELRMEGAEEMTDINYSVHAEDNSEYNAN